MESRRAESPRREGLRGELRRLPSGERAGGQRNVPGARRLPARRRPKGATNGDRAERQAGHGHGSVRQAALRHRPRRGHHLYPQQLGEQDRRSHPAERDQVGAEVTLPYSGEVILRSGATKDLSAERNEASTRSEPMSAVIDSGHAHDEHAHGPYGGIMRWITTTNHKDIGTLYLWFSFTMFLVGGLLALGVRAELFKPGLQLWHPEFFNQPTTMHGLIMVFGAIMPAFVGFANWQVPMMIGAPDMAFARVNNWSFWLLPVGATLIVGSFFVPGGATAAGWTIYAPLSTQMGPGMDLAIFALHIMGASSIMGSINIITTILNMRAPGMTMMRIPLFVWTWLITAYLLIAVMPVLAGSITMLLTDRHFGTSFFNAAGGGDPVMFQHLFWFFGHPEVYI